MKYYKHVNDDCVAAIPDLHKMPDTYIEISYEEYLNIQASLDYKNPEEPTACTSLD